MTTPNDFVVASPAQLSFPGSRVFSNNSRQWSQESLEENQSSGLGCPAGSARNDRY